MERAEKTNHRAMPARRHYFVNCWTAIGEGAASDTCDAFWKIFRKSMYVYNLAKTGFFFLMPASRASSVSFV